MGRTKERKKYYFPLHIFWVALQRTALFGATTYSELTYSEWVERGHNNKGEKKEGRKETRNITINLIVAPCIFVESLLFSTNHCSYITFT